MVDDPHHRPTTHTTSVARKQALSNVSCGSLSSSVMSLPQGTCRTRRSVASPGTNLFTCSNAEQRAVVLIADDAVKLKK